jgi:hypothetical protein
MDLMIHGPSEFIGRAMLRRWLEAIYAAVYDVAPGDERVDRMLAGLPPVLKLS